MRNHNVTSRPNKRKMPPIRANRRQVLKALSAVLGTAATLQVAGAPTAIDVALAYATSNASGPGGSGPGRSGNGRVFSAARLALLHDICARTIPATDTPGAHELDVHGFIDNQLFHCHGVEEQDLARGLLDAIDAAAHEKYGSAFVDATGERQLALLTSLEQARDGFDRQYWQHFKFLKNMIVFGYLTTEIGATKVLAWDPYPGGFTGSIPYASVGKSWLGNV